MDRRAVRSMGEEQDVERAVNTAERLRDERIAKMGDLELLRVLVTEPRDADVTDDEFSAFVDMILHVRAGSLLTRKQRAWAEEVARRITPVRAAEAPKGREVPTPAVLQNLPLKPPGRRVP